MRKERKIINTNIRLNLCDEQDRQAWEYLQTMDREKYKSYTRAVVVALNDYFSREYRNEADPYLETRETEDALLWSSIFVTLMANKIGGLQFGIYRNCQISSRVFHTAVAALPLTKANRSDFE